jgi:hypothetical protein
MASIFWDHSSSTILYTIFVSPFLITLIIHSRTSIQYYILYDKRRQHVSNVPWILFASICSAFQIHTSIEGLSNIFSRYAKAQNTQYCTYIL